MKLKLLSTKCFFGFTEQGTSSLHEDNELEVELLKYKGFLPKKKRKRKIGDSVKRKPDNWK